MVNTMDGCHIDLVSDYKYLATLTDSSSNACADSFHV